jgi:integrase
MFSLSANFIIRTHGYPCGYYGIYEIRSALNILIIERTIWTYFKADRKAPQRDQALDLEFAGIDKVHNVGRVVHIHALRHSFASLLARLIHKTAWLLSLVC